MKVLHTDSRREFISAKLKTFMIKKILQSSIKYDIYMKKMALQSKNGRQ